MVTDITRCIAQAHDGIICREGVTAVIVGRPNVGKSSLMNALSQTDRVIVTDVPGTDKGCCRRDAQCPRAYLFGY